MSTTTNPNDILMGGGGPPSIFSKESKIGDVAKGTITKLDTQQVRDFVTQEPKTYPDGNPIMQIVITLRQEHGEEGRLFCKPAMKEAIRNAVLAAGAEGLEVGGRLAVQYSGDEAPEKAGLNPKKLYTAQYEPPKPASISAGDLL